MKFISINKNEVDAIYVVFDNVSAWKIGINRNDSIARGIMWVPIKRE